MMKRGHRACAAPFALGYSYIGAATEWVNPIVAALGAGLIVYFSTFPDYDHPNYRGKRNPVAAAVRGSAKLGYLIRTDNDRIREDQHRGPSHCLEWCVLLGLVLTAPMVALSVAVPGVIPASLIWFIGGAISMGAASHIVGDVMTPSGVPFSVLYNVIAYRGKDRQVWRRHALGLFVTDSAGERVGAVPVLYLITAIETLAMVGGLPALWRATTGDIFDGRWVVLALLAIVAVSAARVLASIALFVVEALAAAGVAVVRQTSDYAVRGVGFALGVSLVVVPVAVFVPQWLPWV